MVRDGIFLPDSDIECRAAIATAPAIVLAPSWALESILSYRQLVSRDFFARCSAKNWHCRRRGRVYSQAESMQQQQLFSLAKNKNLTSLGQLSPHCHHAWTNQIKAYKSHHPWAELTQDGGRRKLGLEHGSKIRRIFLNRFDIDNKKF